MQRVAEEEEIEVGLSKKFLCFGLEAIIAMFLGTIFLFLSTISLWKTKIIEKLFEKIVDYFPFLRFFGMGPPVQEEIAPRIGSEDCCICFSGISREVSSTCGHIFCGKCLVDFWESKNRQKIQCPLCRRDINMIIVNFAQSDFPQNDSESHKVIENVRFYNACFSKQQRTMFQILLDSPYLMRRLIFSLATREGFTFFLKRVLKSLYIMGLVLYIISPLDLIPDYIPIIGWIDDGIAVINLILYITILYYNFLRERN